MHFQCWLTVRKWRRAWESWEKCTTYNVNNFTSLIKNKLADSPNFAISQRNYLRNLICLMTNCSHHNYTLCAFDCTWNWLDDLCTSPTSSSYMCRRNWFWFKRFLHFLGAFLIPFMIMLILEGIPLFLIELGMGQRMRLGALGVWNTIHPWLGGIGISSCVVTLFVAIYYNVIITWCIFYFVNSFRVSSPSSFLRMSGLQ